MALAPVSIHSHADCDGIAIQVYLQGCPPMRLQMPQPDYWFVMFNKLAFDRLVLPPPPSDEPGTHA
jgi:hypothetical protein